MLTSHGNAAGLDEYLYQKAPLSSRSPDYAEHFEARGGVFAHGIGSVERNTVDINLEMVFPRLLSVSAESWSYFVPRLYLGGFVNTSNRTSIAYAGALWTFSV